MSEDKYENMETLWLVFFLIFISFFTGLALSVFYYFGAQ